MLFLLSTPALACTGQTPCTLGDRTYHVREPDGWDGVSDLRVLIHFHGWGRQGTLIVNHDRIARHTRMRDVLLIAPNGRGRTWDFRRANSSDLDFIDELISEIRAGYPIDPDHIYVSGYSYGAIMAQRYACERGDNIRAVLSISGTLPQTTDCPEAPLEVRHVHGLDDTVLRYPMGPNGDTTHPVRLWRENMECVVPLSRYVPWQAVSWLAFERTTWSDCTIGTVILDTHPGGHFIPHGWIGWQLDELVGRTPSYP